MKFILVLSIFCKNNKRLTNSIYQRKFNLIFMNSEKNVNLLKLFFQENIFNLFNKKQKQNILKGL